MYCVNLTEKVDSSPSSVPPPAAVVVSSEHAPAGQPVNEPAVVDTESSPVEQLSAVADSHDVNIPNTDTALYSGVNEDMHVFVAPPPPCTSTNAGVNEGVNMISESCTSASDQESLLVSDTLGVDSHVLNISRDSELGMCTDDLTDVQHTSNDTANADQTQMLLNTSTESGSKLLTEMTTVNWTALGDVSRAATSVDSYASCSEQWTDVNTPPHTAAAHLSSHTAAFSAAPSAADDVMSTMTLTLKQEEPEPVDVLIERAQRLLNIERTRE